MRRKSCRHAHVLSEKMPGKLSSHSKCQAVATSGRKISGNLLNSFLASMFVVMSEMFSSDVGEGGKFWGYRELWNAHPLNKMWDCKIKYLLGQS